MLLDIKDKILCKAAGKSWQKRIVGLQEATENQPPAGMTTDKDLRTELTRKREKKQQLLHRVQLLEERVEQLKQKRYITIRIF